MIKLKTTIGFLLLISTVFVYFINPLFVNAQTTSGPTVQSRSTILFSGLTCIGTTFLATWLVNRLTDGIQKLTRLLPPSLKQWLGLLNEPAPDNVPTEDKKFRHEVTTKEKVLDVAARCTARAIMEDLNERMIGAVRTSGRDSRFGRGEPSFVRHWRNFLAHAQYRGENIFRSILGDTVFCDHFSAPLRILFRANNQPTGVQKYTRERIGNLDSYRFRANCTMPQGWVLQNYVNDFAGNGGWDALVRLAEPQNNFYGALMLAGAELGVQKAVEEKSDELEAQTGNSFTGRRGKPGDNCWLHSYNNSCLIYKDILTPGGILQQTAAATIQSELAWITSVDEWEEILQELIHRIVMPRILNLAQRNAYDQEPFDPSYYPETGNNPFLDQPDSGTNPVPTPPTGSITVCAHINWGPPCETFSADDPDLSNNTIGTNTISSVAVGPSTRVILFDLPNYGGALMSITVNTPDLTLLNYNDIASSLQVRSGPTGPQSAITVNVYLDSNQNGTRDAGEPGAGRRSLDPGPLGQAGRPGRASGCLPGSESAGKPPG